MKNIKESYKDFDWEAIRDYCNQLNAKDFSKMREDEDHEDLYNFLNDYFELLKIEFASAPDYLQNENWKDRYICNGQTHSNGYIYLYVDFEQMLDDLQDPYTKKDVVTSIATTVVHELTHRYQVTQFSDRRWDKIKSENDYLSQKDEISAHITGGVSELLNKGYTKKQLLNKLKTLDSDCKDCNSFLWDSDSLRYYWSNFGIFDTKDKTWLKFKKELTSTIYNLKENIKMKRNRLQERNHPIHDIYADYRDENGYVDPDYCMSMKDEGRTNRYMDMEDAIEGLMILEDKSDTDDYFCIDKDNEIYKIFDSSEGVVKVYDYENDYIIDEIPYEDLSRDQQLDINEWEYDKDHA